jgi:integrase
MVRDDMIKLDWSRRYCNKATSIIKRCFAWAAEEELIPAAVSNGLIPVKGLKKGRTAAREKAPIGPVDDAHVEAILPKVSELVADVLRTMRLTGMRPGEAVSMTPAEIDRSDPTCWMYRPGHHKNAHKDIGRAIPLGSRAQELILPRLLKAGENSPIFELTRSSLRTAVLRGCDRAGVPRFGPNRIRHTVGTEVRSKFGLEAAQVLLGHTRADVTQTYAERDMAKAQDVARRIG